LRNPLTVLIDLLPQIKSGNLLKVESIAIQIQHLDFFSDTAINIISHNEGTGLRLGLDHL